MRNTLSAWRSTSTAPMYTLHSSPSSAAAVALATPCWPAPVSATRRVLPIRFASRAWPSTLLILCDPVWLRSSRLSSTVTPSSLAEAMARRGTGWAAGEVAEQPVELAAEAPDRPTPGGTRPPAPRTPARASRARSARRTLRTARSADGSPIRLMRRLAYSSAQSYGKSSGPRYGCGAAAAGVGDERLELQRVLAAGLTARRRTTRRRPTGARVDGAGDVVGRQAAGEDDPQALGHVVDQPQSNTLPEPGAGASTRIMSVAKLVGATGVVATRRRPP